MAPAQIFLWWWTAFLIGVGAASLVSISRILFFVLSASTVFLFIAGLAARKHKAAVAAILLFGFIFGFWRFDIMWQKTTDNDLTRLNGQTVEIVGTIVNDPVLKSGSQQIILRPDGVSGKILVIADRYPEYQYGDKICFVAELEEAKNFSDFDYKNYLAKDGIYSMARWPEIELVSGGNGNPVYSGLLWIKHRLERGIAQSLPSPQDSLLTAILLGDQSGLGEDLKEKLNISGLRHLSAVSGAHVAIMAQIIAPFLIWLGWWRQKALWATIVFVWLFVAMIGLPASAVRAAIMGSLAIFAQIIGRPGDTLRIVVIAAALMVLQNPLILRFDVGFQLSFLAVLGMVFFTRPLEKKLKFMPAKPEFIRPALAVALSAQIFTLPVLVYNFGYVSIYGLLANVLAEPVVPFITIYGFVLAVCAAVSLAMGWILFFPIWLALSYLLAITGFFAGLPGAVLSFKLDFFWLVLSYIILGVIAWYIQGKEKLDFLR